MKPLNALALYRVRLRARLWQEAFAVLGIAAGVALLFASQISTSSLQSSVARLSRGIAGRATLQLRARDAQGFPAETLTGVRGLPGVRVAAPVVEASAVVHGPRGSRPVELIGADQSLSRLGGDLAHDSSLRPFGGIGAVVLPAPLAQAVGVTRFGQEAIFEVSGRRAEAPLYSELHERQLGALLDSPIAVVPLSLAQEMTGTGGRISRILVEPAPGAERTVRDGLERLAAGRIDVRAIDYEQSLFAKAAEASNQSTQLFAAVSALVGFLFAFNAMLFTVPQRRRLIVDLRRDGYTPATVIGVLLLDAVALGSLSSLLGLGLGEIVSMHVLGSNPAFLSLAFSLGSERLVSWQSAAFAVGGGMLAATLAVLSPLRDVLSSDPLAATGSPDRPVAIRARRRAALAGIVCLACATATLAAAPDAAIPGMVLVVAALLLLLPLGLSSALSVLRRAASQVTGVVPHVAAMELDAAGARALAIGATGAVAIFGSVAIRGAHRDLLAGLENATRSVNAPADVWVSPAGSYDLMHTTPFPAADGAKKLSRVQGVRAVQDYRGGLLDYGPRRVLVIAPPSDATPLLPPGQMVEGDVAKASEWVRDGGWVVLSKALAAERHLRIGQSFTLPSPEPTSFRVAALSTNLGWAPGAIVMNASDYARAWHSADVSAFGILLAPGAQPASVVKRIDTTLGPHSGLLAQTAGAHAAAQDALSRQALSRLTEIAGAIPIAAVLAMAAALGAMIWQRRPRLAKLKLEGIPRTELWVTILLESLMLLGLGCSAGAAFGIYGQRLADRALASTINFPVVHTFPTVTVLSSLALVSAATLAILAVPGYLATSVPAGLALAD
jgi:putative ABC transport system permease protein